MKTVSEIEFDLAQLGEFIADLSGQKRSLSNALTPYWNMKRDLEQQIRESFPSKHGCLQFSFAKKENRRIMHNKILCLSEEYGDLAEQYRDLGADIDAAIRNKKRLLLWLDDMQKRERLL